MTDLLNRDRAEIDRLLDTVRECRPDASGVLFQATGRRGYVLVDVSLSAGGSLHDEAPAELAAIVEQVAPIAAGLTRGTVLYETPRGCASIAIDGRVPELV
jgi:hypothetical protein